VQWKGEGWLFVLVDVDALVPQGEEPWTGDRTLEIRKDLFKTLGRSINDGGWLGLRTCPSRGTGAQLSELDVEQVFAPETEGCGAEEVRLFAPEIRPVARWLLEEAGFRPRDLSRIVEQVAQHDAHLLHLAYQCLSPAARDAGKLLSTLRPSQHYNGMLGPFAFAEQHPNPLTVPRDAVEEQREAGFLQPGGEASMLRMPRAMRRLLRDFASFSMAAAVRAVHQRLGFEPFEARPPAEQMEIHHHAVEAGDVARAKQTAKYYGTELRALATRIGLDANRTQDRVRHQEAAELFQEVVDRFDERDAYAWEYLGYNLARCRDASQNDRILRAYERALDLWDANPLYRGRLLGFRGQLGVNVASEVMSWLDHYVSAYGDETDAVSRFAEPALQGLRRGGQQTQIDEILRRRRSILQRFAPRALTSPGDDE
jgi:hypothetical protein